MQKLSSVREETEEIARPSKDLCDIVVDCYDSTDTNDVELYRCTFSNLPNVIINDWFYLGNAENALDLAALKKLGITHILNITNNIGCYFINNDFEYARICIDDVEESNLFDYFEATAKFIDQCNPYYYYKDAEVMQEMQTNIDWKQPRILVHCVAGISRSSTIVISYLISRIVRYNQIEQNILNYIKKSLDHQVTVKRTTYLTLSEAFYYVQSCRSQIWPNDGFMDQLEKYEVLCNKINNTQSTRDEISPYTTVAYRAKIHANNVQTVRSSQDLEHADHEENKCDIKSCNIL